MYYGWKIPLENPIPILLLNSATFTVYYNTRLNYFRIYEMHDLCGGVW